MIYDSLVLFRCHQVRNRKTTHFNDASVLERKAQETFIQQLENTAVMVNTTIVYHNKPIKPTDNSKDNDNKTPPSITNSDSGNTKPISPDGDGNDSNSNSNKSNNNAKNDSKKIESGL